jgi:hypothetical protein
MEDQLKLYAIRNLTSGGVRLHAWKIDNPASILQRAGGRLKGKGVFS